MTALKSYVFLLSGGFIASEAVLRLLSTKQAVMVSLYTERIYIFGVSVCLGQGSGGNADGLDVLNSPEDVTMSEALPWPFASGDASSVTESVIPFVPCVGAKIHQSNDTDLVSCSVKILSLVTFSSCIALYVAVTLWNHLDLMNIKGSPYCMFDVEILCCFKVVGLRGKFRFL